MDKWQAQNAFWNSFGIPAYDERSVPDKKDLPEMYITYQQVNGFFGASRIVAASIWHRSPSWEGVQLKEAEIGAACNPETGGVKVAYDGGQLWFTAEDDFSTTMDDPNDDMLRRMRLAVILQFL